MTMRRANTPNFTWHARPATGEEFNCTESVVRNRGATDADIASGKFVSENGCVFARLNEER